MAGTPHRNLRMFGELCGDQAVKKVVLVTTMWDRVQQDTGVRRENELVENYWKKMINLGASTAHFSNTADSAWKIVEIILKHHESQVLLLQEEIVDFKRALNETEAGKTLYSDLQRLLAEQKDTVHSLMEQARDESNPELARQLEAELKDIQKDLDKTFSDIKDLKIPFSKNVKLLLTKTLKKPRAVRLVLNLRIIYILYSLICMNRNAYFCHWWTCSSRRFVQVLFCNSFIFSSVQSQFKL